MDNFYLPRITWANGLYDWSYKKINKTTLILKDLNKSVNNNSNGSNNESKLFSLNYMNNWSCYLVTKSWDSFFFVISHAILFFEASESRRLGKVLNWK